MVPLADTIIQTSYMFVNHSHLHPSSHSPPLLHITHTAINLHKIPFLTENFHLLATVMVTVQGYHLQMRKLEIEFGSGLTDVARGALNLPTFIEYSAFHYSQLR